jgi:arylsulfatase A-like enzyme
MRSRPSALVAIAVMLALIAPGSTPTSGAQRNGAADRPDIIVMADIGGTQLPTADGTSFLPLHRGEPFTGHTYLLELETTSHATARIYWAAVRTREWRLIRWSTWRRELYRLSSDPWELTNLVTTDRPTASMLEAQLDALLLAAR